MNGKHLLGEQKDLELGSESLITRSKPARPSHQQACTASVELEAGQQRLNWLAKTDFLLGHSEGWAVQLYIVGAQSALSLCYSSSSSSLQRCGLPTRPELQHPLPAQCQTRSDSTRPERLLAKDLRRTCPLEGTSRACIQAHAANQLAAGLRARLPLIIAASGVALQPFDFTAGKFCESNISLWRAPVRD